MAHIAEIIIPGSFVCLQGSPGDGLCNFLTHGLPRLPRNTEIEEIVLHSNNNDDQHAESVACRDAETEQPVVPEPQPSSPVPILGQLAKTTQMNTNLGGLATDPTSPVAPSSSSASSSQRLRQQQQNMDESIDSATDDQQETDLLARKRKCERSVEEWAGKCREKEEEQRTEWRDTVLEIKGHNSTGHAMMDNFEEVEMWWQTGGRIAVLSDVPTKMDTGKVMTNTIGTLSPGATIVATDIVYLDSNSFERLVIPPTALSGDNNVYPKPRSGWIQLIQVDYEGHTGYVCLSLDGYWLLAPGLPSRYIDPHAWLWRVICPAGAFIREGLELNTRHVDTLPYGSFVRVTRRTVNSQGLVRLKVQSMIDDTEKDKQCWVDGWCSEYLNPQSGQRGIVVHPLSFPVPALYRVTLPIGAVIRSDIELSSPQIGVAPMDEILPIVGKAFSEHPVDKCIERLQLAGNGGWISVRLNRPPPNDDLVVELIGVDGKYDPDHPGFYHLEGQQRMQRTVNSLAPDTARNNSSGDLSSIDSVSSEISGRNMSSRNSRHGPESPSSSSKCLICLSEERNATIVHGETGHVACCLICARILKARGDNVSQKMEPWNLYHVALTNLFHLSSVPSVGCI
jgi:hypothetical protein